MEAHNRLYIGGAWQEPTSGAVLDLVSPHTGEVFATAASAGADDIDRAVTAARAAHDSGEWSRLPPAERVDAVRRLAAAAGERRREMAALITAEMGSPISFSKFAQATLPTILMSTFADVADAYEWESTRPGAYGQDILVRKEPTGVVAAIVPWNMPQFLIAGKLAPALLAGCSIVIKPAAETAARRPPPRRDHRRDRPAPGRGQHRARRPGGRRAPGGPPRRRQGRVHRIHGCWPPGRGPLRPGPQAGQPRAGRQVGGHRARRRRPAPRPPRA